MYIFKSIFLLFFDERQWLKMRSMTHNLFHGNIYNNIAMLAFSLVAMFLAVSLFVKKDNKPKLRTIALLSHSIAIIMAMILGRPSGKRVFIMWTIDMFYNGVQFHETSILLVAIKMFIFIIFGYLVIKKYYDKKTSMCVLIIIFTPVITETIKYLLAKGVPSLGGIMVHVFGGLIGLLLGQLSNAIERSSMNDIGFTKITTIK